MVGSIPQGPAALRVAFGLIWVVIEVLLGACAADFIDFIRLRRKASRSPRHFAAKRRQRIAAGSGTDRAGRVEKHRLAAAVGRLSGDGLVFARSVGLISMRGAQTPACRRILLRFGIALASLFLTPLLFNFCPMLTLAATIIDRVCLSLVYL